MADMPPIKDEEMQPAMDLLFDIKQRLSALEAENKTLKAELADIKQNGIRKAIPPAPVAERPMIFHPVETVYANSPTDSELRQLRTICANSYPGWTNSAGFVVSRGPRDMEANDVEGCINFRAASWRSRR